MHTRFTHYMTLAIITLFMTLSAPVTANNPSPFQIAVSPKLKIETLKTSELSKVFSGRRSNWNNSTPVQLILLPTGSPEMRWLCDQLKVPEHLLRRFIFQRVYRAQLRKPIEVSTASEAIQVLANTPGAIAPLRVNEALIQSLKASGASPELNLIKLTP